MSVIWVIIKWLEMTHIILIEEGFTYAHTPFLTFPL